VKNVKYGEKQKNPLNSQKISIASLVTNVVTRKKGKEKTI
jgi:hypothetical protein